MSMDAMCGMQRKKAHVVGACADDLDEHGLVSASAFHGLAQLLGVELGRRRHERQDDVLKVASELVLQYVIDHVTSRRVDLKHH